MNESFDQIRNFRIEKLNKLRELGIEPYPYEFSRSHTITEIIEQFAELLESEKIVSTAGRLMAIREMGKASFCNIQDMSRRIQLYVKKSTVGEEGYSLFKLLDIGDSIGVKGKVFKTRTGEISIFVDSIELLAKAIRPFPIVKIEETKEGEILHDQFSDKELRYRQRYVDLNVNPDVKEVFIRRSKIISVLRRFLEDRNYLEVETPVLQPLYGGAFARPFTTELHSLKMRLYLRIADELYLKRLIVGGFDGVFEISKDFRNEGMDRFHNPEFTMMELYVAYKDYHFMMGLVEEMVVTIAQKVLGKTTIINQEQEINLLPPWKRIPFFKAIEEVTGYDLETKNIQELFTIAEKLGVNVEKYWERGKILDEIYGEIVEPTLIQPTFIIDHPIEMSPLAKTHRNNHRLVERFETIIMGRELANAFSELNDPFDQRERFEQQMNFKAKGDEEAQVLDEDYIHALEYGMPPTAGIGIGVDRLVMLLTNSSSIRDVLLFPQMRPIEKR